MRAPPFGAEHSIGYRAALGPKIKDMSRDGMLIAYFRLAQIADRPRPSSRSDLAAWAVVSQDPR